MPFRKLPLWHFLLFYHPEISRGQYVASLLLPFSVQYSLSSFRKVQSRLPTFWWDACFPCSTERTLRLLLEPRFPMLAHEKTFPWLLYFFYCHQRLILGAFSPSNFFFLFCQVKLHLRVTMLICFRWRLFYIYKTRTHWSVWTDHPCEYLY